MRILVNNDEKQFSGDTLFDLITDYGFSDNSGIAIAINETVIPRINWKTCILREGDAVLIITPAQGG